jgi:type IV pilus assembly protein PilW
MVGLVIGLLTSLAVAQVYATWTKQSRTVSSTNDAQSTLALAAYVLEQDLKQGGQGFASASSTTSGGAGCPVTGSVTVGGTNTAISLLLSGAQIVNGVNGAPDQLVSFYGNSSYRVTPEPVVSSSTTITRVRSRTGFYAGDIVVLGNSTFSDCRLAEVTSRDTLTLNSDKAFEYATGSYQNEYCNSTRCFDYLDAGGGSARTAVYNQAGGVVGTFTAVFDLGPQPQANRWSVLTTSPQNPVLQRASVLPVDGVFPPNREVAEGIVNLQFQYGYDLDGNGQIGDTEWYDADAAGAPDIGSTVDWTRVLAVRYAILARSRNYVPPPYPDQNANAPTWTGGNAGGTAALHSIPFVMTDLGGTADNSPSTPLNWRGYRYSVAQGVVPFRNALWGRNL